MDIKKSALGILFMCVLFGCITQAIMPGIIEFTRTDGARLDWFSVFSKSPVTLFVVSGIYIMVYLWHYALAEVSLKEHGLLSLLGPGILGVYTLIYFVNWPKWGQYSLISELYFFAPILVLIILEIVIDNIRLLESSSDAILHELTSRKEHARQSLIALSGQGSDPGPYISSLAHFPTKVLKNELKGRETGFSEEEN